MTALHRTAYWQRLSRKWRPLIQAQLPLPCVNAGAHPSCTGVVMPTDKWHLGHLPGHDYSITHDIHPTIDQIGPSHYRCNLAAGGRIGTQKQRHTKSRETRHFPW